MRQMRSPAKPDSDGQRPSKPKGSAFDSAARMLGLREHSRAELAKKLDNKGFESGEIDQALERLVELGYLDDQRFAQTVVRQHPHLGRRALAAQMRRRGVPESAWVELVSGIDSDEEFDRALSLARKGPRVPDDRDELERWSRRLAGRLGRRGFSQATVIRVISQLRSES